MDLAEIEHYLDQIEDLEFKDRNYEIRRCEDRLKQALVTRQELAVGEGLQGFSEFYLAEFKERINYLTNQLINAIIKINRSKADEICKRAVTAFSRRAGAQFAYLFNAFESLCRDMEDDREAPDSQQVRDTLRERMQDHLRKNQLTVEYEFLAFEKSLTNRSIPFGEPTYYGIRYDIQELWRRYSQL